MQHAIACFRGPGAKEGEAERARLVRTGAHIPLLTPGPGGTLTTLGQIVPTVLGQLLQHSDARKAERVMKAMLQMTRLDIKALEAAAA